MISGCINPCPDTESEEEDDEFEGPYYYNKKTGKFQPGPLRTAEDSSQMSISKKASSSKICFRLQQQLSQTANLALPKQGQVCQKLSQQKMASEQSNLPGRQPCIQAVCTVLPGTTNPGYRQKIPHFPDSASEHNRQPKESNTTLNLKMAANIMKNFKTEKHEGKDETVSDCGEMETDEEDSDGPEPGEVR